MIDAKNVMKDFKQFCDDLEEDCPIVLLDALELLEEQAERIAIMTEDQPEVVRCKDCKYGTSYSNGTMFGCITINGLHDADWFCADGKRRNDDA